MRVCVSVVLLLVLALPARAVDLPKPRWAKPFPRRHPCLTAVVAASALGAAIAWGYGAFDVTKPDETVPSRPLPDDAPKPPQQFPPPNVGDEVPDLP